MGRKVVSGIMLVLLTMGMLSLTFNIQPAKSEWTGTVYIRADGSIDPSDAPITTFDNVTYFLAGKISGSIVLERDNVILDGAGYTLDESTGFDIGINITERNNVTIKNANINRFFKDIYISHSSNITVSGNNLTRGSENGVIIEYSFNNRIIENTFVDCGLSVRMSYGNVVTDNLVNGKPLAYLEGVSDYVVDNAGQVILVNCNNITVRNLELSNVNDAIRLIRTNNSNIVNNGIGFSFGMRIRGIGLIESLNNSIHANNVTNYLWEAFLINSSHNIFSENNITYVELWNSPNNIFIDNYFMSGYTQSGSPNNTLIGNMIGSVYIVSSPNTMFRNNTISGFSVNGDAYSDFIQDVDASNTVHGKPIYYWINQENSKVPSDAGYVALVNSTNITVRSLTLEACPYMWAQLIMLAFTSNSRILNNNLTNSWTGIYLIGSFNNTLAGNKIENTVTGIAISSSFNNTIKSNLINETGIGMSLSYSNSNKIFHNNFINPFRCQVSSYTSTNIWNDGYPSGGNYWSDYKGTDVDDDGIGDTAYVIDENNVDNYPLMGMFNSFITSIGYSVGVVSNSTIGDFRYFESNSTIVMHVSNMTANQTAWFCRLTIPHDVMSPPYTVKVNGTTIEYQTVYENHTEGISIIYFTYEHSKLEIVITPEFPSITIMLLLLIVISIIVPVKRKVLRRSFQHNFHFLYTVTHAQQTITYRH